jgi:hypothetical protein
MGDSFRTFKHINRFDSGRYRPTDFDDDHKCRLCIRKNSNNIFTIPWQIQYLSIFDQLGGSIPPIQAITISLLDTSGSIPHGTD